MPLATILVVDDSAEILELTSSTLEEAGYAVLRCDSGRQALTVLGDGHAVDLLLTDIGMPCINGFELARRATAMHPSLLVAYITGNAEAAAEAGGEVPGRILRKPYRQEGLTREIQELMEPGEDARLLRVVAQDMMQRHSDALARATEAADLDSKKGDKLSTQAWRDIAQTIATLTRR
jgi:two-component system cell cycle response regulator CpdR